MGSLEFLVDFFRTEISITEDEMRSLLSSSLVAGILSWVKDGVSDGRSVKAIIDFLLQSGSSLKLMGSEWRAQAPSVAGDCTFQDIEALAGMGLFTTSSLLQVCATGSCVILVSNSLF